MDTYTVLRQFADSWALLGLTLAFLGVVLWTLRPGSAGTHREIAQIPLRNDRLPPDAAGPADARSTSK